MQINRAHYLHEWAKSDNIVSESTSQKVSFGPIVRSESEKRIGLLNQREQIEKWLRQYGFEYNPFGVADSERDYRLGEYFIEHEDFEKTIGLNNRLVFARPGDGKTAIRLRLQSYYRDSVIDHKVFVFSYLIPLDVATNPPSSINDHLSEILTAAVRHAFIFFALRGVELPQLQNEREATGIATTFATFFDEYYGIVDCWQQDLQQAIHDYSLTQALRNLAPVYDDLESLEEFGSINTQWIQYWLDLLQTTADSDIVLPSSDSERWQLFCNLIKSTGVESILILVDGIDIKPTSQSGIRRPDTHVVTELDSIDRMREIVKPILTSLETGYWGERLFWKLFLPLELYLPLNSLLPSQIEHDIIVWDRNRLLQFLRSRLSSASNGSVTSINQLLAREVSINLEAYLCAIAESSPRKLIYALNNVFAIHVSSVNTGHLPEKLSRSTLAKVRCIANYQSAYIVQS